MEWIQQVFGDLKKWLLFVGGIITVFLFYYNTIFPRVEDILVNKLYRSESQRFCIDESGVWNLQQEKDKECKGGVLHVKVEYPNEISSFSYEVIRIYINWVSESIPKKRICFYMDEYVCASGGCKFYIYTCQNQTNLYQCPSSERRICIEPFEVHRIGRWFVVSRYVSKNGKTFETLAIQVQVENINNSQGVAEPTPIPNTLASQGQQVIENNNNPQGSQNKASITISPIHPIQNFQDFTKVLLRAFIWYMLLPPRSNTLLVTLAAFSVVFFEHVFALEDLPNLIKRRFGETPSHCLEFLLSFLSVASAEMAIILMIYGFVYVTVVWGGGIFLPLVIIPVVYVLAFRSQNRKTKKYTPKASTEEQRAGSTNKDKDKGEADKGKGVKEDFWKHYGVDKKET